MTQHQAIKKIRRVITTRNGGVSESPYDSFNLAFHVGDDPQAVQVNRNRLAHSLGLESDQLVWMDQIHGRTITVVSGRSSGPVEATDALVTAQPGLALAVLTADCVPVLLSDADAGVIAAVHAGRIGARIGIIPKVLEQMKLLGADLRKIGAFLGPAASGRQYEVPFAMQKDIEEWLPGSSAKTVKGTPGLDIRAGIRRQLEAYGVRAIYQDPRCTIEDKTLFSHRRGAPTGRIASIIWMEAQ
ncbi:MAG: peptidoglycan editing factor PgeF [Mycobacteriaceae bacterium]